MAGGRRFDPRLLVALADYVTARVGSMPSEKLAIILWRADFEAYAQTGKSITGATWMRGTWERPLWVREMGEDWFRRYVFSRCPWWAQLLGYAVGLRAAWGFARQRA